MDKFETGIELVIEPSKECMYGVISSCRELERKRFET
jgi:hypothetical protein